MHYTGRYAIDATGAVHIDLINYPSRWPLMYVFTGPQGALLFPTTGDDSFKMGGRSGAYESNKMAPYWPFRQTNRQ